jgi:hypothetical protein
MNKAITQFNLVASGAVVKALKIKETMLEQVPRAKDDFILQMEDLRGKAIAWCQYWPKGASHSLSYIFTSTEKGELRKTGNLVTEAMHWAKENLPQIYVD